MNEAITAAYIDANYIVYDDGRTVVLRIDEKSSYVQQLFERLGIKTAAFITAWNPYSQIATNEENEAANEKLLTELSALCTMVMCGVGQSRTGDWPAEVSFFACGIPRPDAERLGVVYRQNAIIWIGETHIPELVVLRAP